MCIFMEESSYTLSLENINDILSCKTTVRRKKKCDRKNVIETKTGTNQLAQKIINIVSLPITLDLIVFLDQNNKWKSKGGISLSDFFILYVGMHTIFI